MALPTRVVNCETAVEETENSLVYPDDDEDENEDDQDDDDEEDHDDRNFLHFSGTTFSRWTPQLSRANFYGYWIFSQHVAWKMPASRYFDRSSVASRNEFTSDFDVLY